jgi:drug/metabolite transporter (DMT)-like permease
MSDRHHRLKAIRMLVLCCVFWAVSFPTTKALTLSQQAVVPDASSWFLAALCVAYRFGATALIMALVSARTLPRLTRLEFKQGLGLGLFGGGGILLQVDGLAYTSASVSAFLTQCYCLLIPLWVAWRQRRWPAVRIVAACGLVIAGVAVLADVDWRSLHLGRGELETILASVLFTGQILWLERPEYARNNVNHFSVVMFAVMALLCLPVALLTTAHPADWYRAYGSLQPLTFLGILVVVCTLGGYLLMNHWQRHVTAAEAGLIYCLEPVFASLLALFLPGWFSHWAGLAYANEQVTASLLIGGGLITAANVLVQVPLPLSNGRKPEAAGIGEPF